MSSNWRPPSQQSWVRRTRVAASRLVRSWLGTPIVVSFPKSGRTWLRVMLDELGIDAEYTHFGAGVKLALPIEELQPNLAWCRGRPTLLLVRDPRDTALSAYFQATKRLGVYQGDVAQFIRDPRYGVEKIVRFNLMWAELAAGRPGFELLAYEALHRDAPALIARVARFFGQEPSAAQLSAALAAGSIDVMRSREQRGSYDGKYQKALRPGDAADTESYKVRRGVVGGYLEYFDAADVAYSEQILARHDYWRRLSRALLPAAPVGTQVDEPC